MAVSPAPAGSLEALNARLVQLTPDQLFPLRRDRKQSARPRIEPPLAQLNAIAKLMPKLKARAAELYHGDTTKADDLVQETLVRWWERPPRADTETRFLHWLRAVMQSLFANEWRGIQLAGDAGEHLTLPGPREQLPDEYEDR